jgi:cell wall-associated NlpC family hydrolase
LGGAGLDAYHFIDDDGLSKVRFEQFTTNAEARRRAAELQARGVIDDYYIVSPGTSAPDDSRRDALQQALVRTAQRFIGTPYRWGGTSARSGFDCSGLTMTVYRLNGLELPRSAMAQYRAGTPVDRNTVSRGDLVFFTTARRSRVSHVGIYTGGGQFIHAPGRGKSIRTASLDNRYFRSRFRGARRYF